MTISDHQQHLLTAVEDLLESASARELHDSLEDLLLSYLSERNAVLPSDQMVRHVYFLILFLREVGKSKDAEFISA